MRKFDIYKRGPSGLNTSNGHISVNKGVSRKIAKYGDHLKNVNYGLNYCTLLNTTLRLAARKIPIKIYSISCALLGPYRKNDVIIITEIRSVSGGFNTSLEAIILIYLITPC